MNLNFKLLPPSPVTSQIKVDLRAGWLNPRAESVVFSLMHEGKMKELGRFSVSGKSFAKFPLKTKSYVGQNRIECTLLDRDGNILEKESTALEVLKSDNRSSGLIDGAWCGLYHWSEQEGRLWNKELKQFTRDDWRQLVRGMHEVGMDVIILQELFRNEMYQGKHSIEKDGYQGKAFYPSKLFPGRMEIACPEVVEVILDEADRLGMSVLMGIGMYAWFDFSASSLAWHIQVARELHTLYGHHKSLYGWYISEEVFGDLNYRGNGVDTEQEILHFFREFCKVRNELNPAMTLMLAPNCFFITKTLETWNLLARELDIMCPFGFHRMDKNDISCEEVICLFQKIADDNGAHLWLDMEIFKFTDDQALYPRPIQEIVQELSSFSSFEKILCYQYPGLMNAPDASRKPGGESTVELFKAYRTYYQNKKETFRVS
jgi:hypothetical protein